VYDGKTQTVTLKELIPRAKVQQLRRYMTNSRDRGGTMGDEKFLARVISSADYRKRGALFDISP
jgi:hypothetical protein